VGVREQELEYQCSRFGKSSFAAVPESAAPRLPLRIIFFLGIGLMLMAPFMRRFGKASLTLACGATAVLVAAVGGLLRVDPRIGEAAIESNRREYLFILACEMPVLILALISLKFVKWAFWLGWAINLAFAIFVAVIVVWLEFFWHW
jgi:hypothetical protein